MKYIKRLQILGLLLALSLLGNLLMGIYLFDNSGKAGDLKKEVEQREYEMQEMEEDFKELERERSILLDEVWFLNQQLEEMNTSSGGI